MFLGLLIFLVEVNCRYAPGEALIPYCANVPFRCSLARSDQDYLNYFDSRCYCDLFCHTDGYDCCPDFEEVCLNKPSPIAQLTSKATTRPQKSGGRGANRQHGEMNNESIVNTINAMRKGWKARLYRRWSKLPLSLLQERLFNERNQTVLQDIDQIPFYDHDTSIQQFSPPAKYDVRGIKGWPVGPIRDQRGCPLSWAISAFDVAADRFARLTRIDAIWKRTKQPFSVQHLLSCSGVFKGRTCSQIEGSVRLAWRFMHELGTVTEQCYPTDIVFGPKNRTVPECKLFMQRKLKNVIMLGAQFVRLKCPAVRKISQRLFFRIGQPYRIRPSYVDIQYELFLRGPVQATMLACPDFLHYGTGVYRPVLRAGRDQCKYHSVRILGWGHALDRGGHRRLYWICANSWGNIWGEHGYFRIFANESEISRWVVTTFGHGEHYFV